MPPDVSHPTENGSRNVGAVSLPRIGHLAEKILEASMDGILVCDAQSRIVWANPAFLVMTGFDEADVIGKTPRLLRSSFHDEAFYRTMRATLASAGNWQGEIWNRRKNGGIFPSWANINVIHSAAGDVGYFVAYYVDLDSCRDFRRSLHRMAYFDAVTGLPNRNLFSDRLQQALIRAMRTNALLAVLFLDLDGFKAINDTFGHDVGDQVLKAVAERLAHCMREGDTLSRLGGDEFAVVLPDLAEKPVAAQIAERIVDAFVVPFHVRGGAVSVSISIGISLYPDDGDEVTDLIRRADSAMYRAKEARSGYCFFCRSERVQRHRVAREI